MGGKRGVKLKEIHMKNHEYRKRRWGYWMKLRKILIGRLEL